MSKFKRWLFSDWMRGEIRSSYSIFTAQLLADGTLQLLDVYNGDFSQSALMALLVVILRSIVKTVFIRIKLVPSMAKTVGGAGSGSYSFDSTTNVVNKKKKV